jgi:LysM repeat protein
MKFNSENNTKYRKGKQILVKRYFYASFILITIILSTQVLFGLSSGSNFVFVGQQAKAKSVIISRVNSQNLPLPVVVVNVDPNPLKKYEVIPVVGGKTLAPELARANINQADNTTISVYTVKDGDTIENIAKMFNVSVNTILWANDISNKDSLKIGQNLTILPVTGIKYVVKKGDTIETIAKKYNADIEEIQNFNQLDGGSKLTIGTNLIIPDVELSSSNQNTVVRALNGMVVPDDPLLVNTRKLPDLEDYYSCPVAGRLTQGLHGRNSVDLGAPIDTPVMASADGSVTVSKSSGWNGGYGIFVVISHSNGTQTLYAHMKKTNISVGDIVKKGDIIGNVGITGMTTGPHLHFEVRGARNPFSSKKCI